jgi:hypothetical protein
VKVRYVEELAIHSVPESCAVIREGGCEALTGVRAGQVLSRERMMVPGADMVTNMKGNTDGRAMRAPDGPAWSKTLACADIPCTGTGRSWVWPAKALPVPVGEARSRSR